MFYKICKNYFISYILYSPVFLILICLTFNLKKGVDNYIVINSHIAKSSINVAISLLSLTVFDTNLPFCPLGSLNKLI